MKKVVLFAVFLLGLAAVAAAQDVPKAELFGGYSYLRCDAEGNSDCNLNGWNASIAINANKYLGIVGDFTGVYGTVDDSVNVKLHTFLFGPKIAFRGGRLTPFAQALFGSAHLRISDESNWSDRDNHFAMTLGGGLDINAGEYVAIRLFQMEYLLMRIDRDNRSNFKLSAGIVFKLGK